LKEAKEGEAHQKYMWECLRKSLNGIVNKVNVGNISHIVMELFNENLLRGRGLLVKSIIKAQT
jgi:pre-mRNA-splicing factor CWC22